MDEPIPALSVGSVEGGTSPSTPLWRDAIARLAREVAAATPGVDSPLNVNVIFQVPGNILQPDFEGVRTGHYSKKEASLIVQAALPEDVPENVDDHVKDLLVAAVDEAERWANRRGVASDLSSIRELASGL